MFLPRLTFLSHFVLCLACAGLAFFAWANGVLQTIWANDMSMMTSVIGALFVSSAVWLGWEALARSANVTSTMEDSPTHAPYFYSIVRLWSFGRAPLRYGGLCRHSD